MRNAPGLCRSRKGPLITDKLAQDLPLPLFLSFPPPLYPPPPTPSLPALSFHRHTSSTVRGEMQSAALRPAINRIRSWGIISRTVHVCLDRARRDTPTRECGGVRPLLSCPTPVSNFRSPPSPYLVNFACEPAKRQRF